MLATRRVQVYTCTCCTLLGKLGCNGLPFRIFCSVLCVLLVSVELYLGPGSILRAPVSREHDVQQPTNQPVPLGPLRERCIHTVAFGSTSIACFGGCIVIVLLYRVRVKAHMLKQYRRAGETGCSAAALELHVYILSSSRFCLCTQVFLFSYENSLL